jgi:hypothetical protein
MATAVSAKTLDNFQNSTGLVPESRSCTLIPAAKPWGQEFLRDVSTDTGLQGSTVPKNTNPILIAMKHPNVSYGRAICSHIKWTCKKKLEAMKTKRKWHCISLIKRISSFFSSKLCARVFRVHLTMAIDTDALGCGHTECKFMRLLVLPISTVFDHANSYDRDIHTQYDWMQLVLREQWTKLWTSGTSMK